MLPTDFQAAKPKHVTPSQRGVGAISARRPARWNGTACCGDNERAPQFPSSQSSESHAQNTTSRVIRQATDVRRDGQQGREADCQCLGPTNATRIVTRIKAASAVEFQRQIQQTENRKYNLPPRAQRSFGKMRWKESGLADLILLGASGRDVPS